MKSMNRKKLGLHRETLRDLDRRSLASVAGGIEAQTIFTSKICDPFASLAGTCLSCDGPSSCDVPRITTTPL